MALCMLGPGQGPHSAGREAQFGTRTSRFLSSEGMELCWSLAGSGFGLVQQHLCEVSLAYHKLR